MHPPEERDISVRFRESASCWYEPSGARRCPAAPVLNGFWLLDIASARSAFRGTYPVGHRMVHTAELKSSADLAQLGRARDSSSRWLGFESRGQPAFSP